MHVHAARVQWQYDSEALSSSPLALEAMVPTQPLGATPEIINLVDCSTLTGKLITLQVKAGIKVKEFKVLSFNGDTWDGTPMDPLTPLAINVDLAHMMASGGQVRVSIGMLICSKMYTVFQMKPCSNLFS